MAEILSVQSIVRAVSDAPAWALDAISITLTVAALMLVLGRAWRIESGAWKEGAEATGAEGPAKVGTLWES